MRIVLLGPPGAGKGTQSKVMARELKLPHISTGDLLRGNVSQGTELGKKAIDFMNRGLLVPDELVRAMLDKRFDQPDVKGGFILDGYPRNINQAKTLDVMLKDKKMGIDLVFYLDTSEKIIIQRLSGRLVCSKCGDNFHKTNMPPKAENICDKCQASLYQRTDDKEETIKKRLEVYRQEADPLNAYYKETGKLYSVAADEPAETVLKKIIEISRKHNDTHKVSG